MKDITEIKALIERFFEGETTLEEEQRLYDYFKQTKDLPGELETYREMFLGFDAIALSDTASPILNKVEHEVPLTAREIPVSTTPPKYRTLWKQAAGIAAMVIAVFGSVWAYQAYESMKLQSIYGGSYMIVDGKRIDNLREILPEIKRTLSLADAIETTSPTLLIDQAEQDLLNNIQDDRERERIRQLLNQ